MTQNTTTAKAHKATPVGTFNMRMGNTTYVIGVHFSKESKAWLMVLLSAWIRYIRWP